MSRSLFCFTVGHNSSYSQLTERLKELAEDSNRKNSFSVPFSDEELGCGVQQVVVSSSHLALLLEDGRVLRVAYGLASDTGSVHVSKDKSDDDCASTSSALSVGSRSTSPRPDLDGEGGGGSGGGSGSGLSSIVHRFSSLVSGSSRLSATSRSRILMGRRGMSRLLGRVHSTVSSTEVPERLVEQAMAVLQGKSREVVIRELQRTNLDVNSAVNNLLSRDDEDGAGDHDDAVLGFLPSGELLSLVGSGVLAEEELEELITASGRNREEAGRGRDLRALYDDPMVQQEIRSWVTLADRAAGGPGGSSSLGSSSAAGRHPTNTLPIHLHHDSAGSLVRFGSHLLCWREGDQDLRFTAIAGLSSELLAVDCDGNLKRWLWTAPQPVTGPHPRTSELGLEGEKIRLLSARLLRATAVTRNGGVVTWLDNAASSVGSLLEHSVKTLPELSSESITNIYTSELFSVASTDTGRLFWWGVLPFSECKHVIAVAQDRSHSLPSSVLRGESIAEGSKVRLRSRPIFSVGCRAIHIKGHKVQCGELQEAVFSLNDKCRFRIISPSSSSREEPKDTLGPGPSLGSKRSHPGSGEDEEEEEEASKEEEAMWGLRDVVFVDPPLSSAPVGVVKKLDGLYAAVLFPSSLKDDEKEEGERESTLKRCRLLRKDDLILISSDGCVGDPLCIQSAPKRLRLPADSTVRSISVDTRGVTLLISSQGGLSCCSFNMDSGRVTINSPFPQPSAIFLLQQMVPNLLPLNLFSLGLNLWLLEDGKGGLYPLGYDCAGNMKHLPFLHLPPAHVVATAPCSGKHLLVAVVFHSQRLLPLVRKGSASGLLSLLNSISSEEVQQCLKEETSGGCNVLHVIAALTAPTPPPTTSSSSSAGGPRGHHSRHSGLREMMKHALALASSSTSSNVEARLSAMADQGSGEEEMEEGDHSTAAHSRGLSSSFISCLDHICSFSSREPQVLLSLMQMCNLEGFTPFMSAVFQKSYSVALKLLDLAVQLSSDDVTLVSMLFPPGSHPDDNPVFVLCRGDPCSFTWTGQEHIYQDIFECRTCGLMGTLCCCTECAYTCHRGHNCSFKRASPNAYCDCWEKCSCKTLAGMDSGMMGMRMTLLLRLIKYPALSTVVNARGEHLLEMLIGISARQKREQHQWAGRRSGPLRQHHHRSLRFEYSTDVPAHNMDPPRFASRALNIVMEDWTSVLETLMTGAEQRKVIEEKGGVGEWPFFLTSAEQHQVLSGQSATQHLDNFTNTLLSKMCHPIIETLVTTLVQQLMTHRGDKTVIVCCERFIRSVLRVMVVSEVEKRGSTSSAVLVTSSGSSKRRSSSADNDHTALYKEATYVLNSLVPLALPQLLSMAKAVILPVCMGVVRPFSPSLMSERHKIASELFQLPPADLYRLPKRPSAPSGTPVVLDLLTEPSDSGSDGEAEAEAENEEVHTHGDASSTATVGSNPIPFFSDQESSDNEDLESVGEEESLDGTDVMADEETYSITSDGPFHSRVHGHTHWAIPDYSGNVRRLSHSSNNKNTVSSRVTANLLGQAFSLLMRLVVELLQTLPSEGPHPPFVLPTLPADEERIHEELWTVLKPVWEWLSTVMDSTEAQLRLGCSLSGGGLSESVAGKSTSASSSSGRSSDTVGSENKRGFLSYLLSVMRCESNEHADCLPALDVGRMEHVAYVLDALVSLLRNTPPPTNCRVLEQHSLASENMTRFFRRTNSTVCLGYPPPSPFGPLVEALPLAEQPQLLHPCQTKETMFGFTMQGNMTVWPRTTLPPSNFLPLIDHAVPVSAGLSHADRAHRIAGDASIAVGVELSRDQVVCENSYSLTACVLMGRWCMTIDLLSQAFADNISKGNLSVFSGLRSFEVMEREFRREMDSLKTAAHRDLQFEVDRSRDKLLSGVFCHLNSTCEFRRSSGGGQPLSTHRLKVVFTNEPGEGSGVVRSFFTAFAEAVLSEECIPEEQQSSRAVPDYSQDFMLFKRRGYQQEMMMDVSDSEGERCPLFFQPGKPGFYSVRAGPPTPLRLNAYRNVGRIIGLALLHSEVLPLPLCRHVYKYLINRPVSWHDLAFHDPVMYESMRKLIIDAKENGDSLTGIDISWQVMLGPCEGGKVHDLHPNTSDQLVSAATVYEYVHKYAELRMVGVVEESLQMMRTGVCDVLPTHVLDNVTAEELRLLLCGTPQVDTDALRKITSFVDESRKGADMVARFKTWFWAVVERMSQRERQDLLYFWTSSPAMPANPESYQPHPSVTVRPADDQHLPTANTCISRLYLPLYSSKSLLRAKLLSAIKIKTFGFI